MYDKELEKYVNENYGGKSDLNLRIITSVNGPAIIVKKQKSQNHEVSSHRTRYITIAFDPSKQMNHEQYKGAYYCNTLKDLDVLLKYFISNPALYKEFIDIESNDVLDCADTVFDNSLGA